MRTSLCASNWATVWMSAPSSSASLPPCGEGPSGHCSGDPSGRLRAFLRNLGSSPKSAAARSACLSMKSGRRSSFLASRQQARYRAGPPAGSSGCTVRVSESLCRLSGLWTTSLHRIEPGTRRSGATLLAKHVAGVSHPSEGPETQSPATRCCARPFGRYTLLGYEPEKHGLNAGPWVYTVGVPDVRMEVLARVHYRVEDLYDLSPRKIGHFE